MGPATTRNSAHAVKYSPHAIEAKNAIPIIHITANTTTGGSSKNRT
jgi:hypothetical protein